MTPEAPYLGRDCKTPYPRTDVARRWLWLLVQSTVFRWSPRPLHLWRAFLLSIFGADIPDPTKIVVFPTARVMFPWRLRLEPRSMVGPFVNLYNLAPITLRRGANLSQNCHLCAGTHDFNSWEMPLVTKPISVGENAWLGADVFVGPGVSIGELCVVGARSVVVKDLPAGKICVGNPCRPIKDRVDPA